VANITWSTSSVTKAQRTQTMGHSACTVWFTGLSGSGKSTLANALEARLVASNIAAYVDGDNLRFGLNSDLGFSPEDRTENIRRVGEVCNLMSCAGVVSLSAFISPYRADRDSVRALHLPGEFFEVYVSTPLEVCESRDVKGLYVKARSGEIPEFSGISAPYEAPLRPDLQIDTSAPIERCVDELVAALGLRS
jgi:adenylylsulfate kinase